MFDYRENGQPLVHFLWRFTHLSPVQRGIDDTVRLANLEETKLAKQHLADRQNPHERPAIVFQV
jgi:hypothetical protein